MPKEFSAISQRHKFRLIEAHIEKCKATPTSEVNEIAGSKSNVAHCISGASSACDKFQSVVKIVESTEYDDSRVPEPILIHEYCDESILQDSKTVDNYNIGNVNIARNVENNTAGDTYDDFDSDAVGSDVSHDDDFENNNYESEEDCGSDTDLESDVRDIVLEGRLTQTLTNKLLRVLRKHGHKELPKDRRTLLHTPKDTSLKFQANSGGQYCHFGFEKCVKRLVTKYFQRSPDKLKVNVFIDGVPLAKSSGSQFWPIMISIVADFYTEPIVVGLYHGFTKPNNATQFLRPFVDDCRECCRLGITINGKLVQVCINCVICDAPARAFVTGTKNHTGYFGCPKCIQEGEFMNHRMTFPEINSALRTDRSFRERSQPEHHTHDSCLEQLLQDTIEQVPIDYMHCVCLGIMRRLIFFWTRGPANVRLPSHTIQTLSKDLVNMKEFVTEEFSRTPRPLQDIDRWKATECRQFLLYTGIVLLQGGLKSNNFYTHFLSLSIAIRILADEELSSSEEFRRYAEDLIVWFINNYATLYDAHFITYNVHVLLHLPECVKKFGPLDVFSAFKFENHMQTLKSQVKTNSRPLEQVVNVTASENVIPVKVQYSKKYPILHFKNNNYGYLMGIKREIKFIQFSGYRVSSKKNNNCCLLQDGSVVLVFNIYNNEQNITYLEVKYFTRSIPFFTKPCNSKKFGISVVSLETLSNIKKIEVKEIKRKCFKIRQKDNTFVIIPLLHQNY